MASVSTLLSLSLVILFGCHYSEVCAGRHHHHRGKGRDGQLTTKLRTLKFSTIIGGQRQCRLQETMGVRMYREMTYCDLGITVTDPMEDWSDPIRNLYERRDRPSDRPLDRQTSPFDRDNITSPTAFSLTRRRFCAHRAVIAARSSFLEAKISQSLGGVKSYSVRHVFIDVIDIPPDVFEYILQYIYTYQIDNFEPERHIIDLFVGAHLLNLEELKKSILEYIEHDMRNSIEQIHSIVQWLRWAQRNRDFRLERTLIMLIRKVLKLDSYGGDTKWQEFGKMICEITQPNYITNLGGPESPRTISGGAGSKK